jgi:hypothetical protein
MNMATRSTAIGKESDARRLFCHASAARIVAVAQGCNGCTRPA